MSEAPRLTDSNGIVVLYDKIMHLQGDKMYNMNLIGDDAKVVQAVVLGIDSRLEVCYAPERGDAYNVMKCDVVGSCFPVRLKCCVSSESMPTLLRRLFEFVGDDEEMDTAARLAQAILDSLDEGRY